MFLQLKNIRKSYGDKDYKVEVLKGIDLSIEKGKFVVLLGPSGSGKSTLLNIIGGIDEADEGDIIINDTKLKNMSEKQLNKYRRNHLGYIFQMYNLIPNLTVRENIETGAYLSNNPLDIDSLINILGLKDHQHKLPNQLSGGQQQRTSIGSVIEPITRIFGLGWRTFAAFLASGFAKEAVLGVLNAIYVGQNSLVDATFNAKTAALDSGLLSTVLAQNISKAEALAFIFACTFNIPCVMALSTTFRESHSFKWTLRVALFYVCGALVLSGIVYHIANLFI